ncbi:hypothetical protein B7L70_04770 [Vulcanisaeta sp. EB80]|nr:hypothetical protein B7L70_04770 [Vulcanisaeta sp. EB80]
MVGHAPGGETPPRAQVRCPPMERSKPAQGPSQGEDAPALLGWGKPAGVGPVGKAGERLSNATMPLSTTNANGAVFFATVLKQLKQREVM